jgi:uncharacterized membrane protein
VADTLSAMFAVVCGREPTHMWAPGGTLLPFCQRCTGLYAGAAVALLLHLWLRIRASDRFLQAHGGFLLLMIPFGYHWLPQDAWIRGLSGVLCGAGLVSFLWLLPGPRFVATQWMNRRRALVYAAGLTVALAGIPASALWGGQFAWFTLVALATSGLAGLAVLAAASMGLGLAALGRVAGRAL